MALKQNSHHDGAIQPATKIYHNVSEEFIKGLSDVPTCHIPQH